MIQKRTKVTQSSQPWWERSTASSVTWNAPSSPITSWPACGCSCATALLDRLQPVVDVPRPGQRAAIGQLAFLVIPLHRRHERLAIDLHHALAALGEFALQPLLD